LNDGAVAREAIGDGSAGTEPNRADRPESASATPAPARPTGQGTQGDADQAAPTEQRDTSETMPSGAESLARLDGDALPERIDDGKGGAPVQGSRDGLLRWLYRGVPRSRTGLQGFQVTIAHPCPYLPAQLERKVWTLLDDAQEPDYDGLARGGFRRSHMIAYRPACPTCSACVPVRIPVERFHWSKSFRRAWKANLDLTAVKRPPVATGEQFRLFQRYLTARHHDGEMAGMTALDYRCMIEDSPVSSQVIELRRPSEPNPAVPPADRDRPDHLTAACLIDVMDDGLSAVYSFFEPGMPQRSLGSYMVLWLVERARELGLSHVYLGYWIAASRKMTYKARFRPLEGLIDGGWRDIDPDDDVSACTVHPRRPGTASG